MELLGKLEALEESLGTADLVALPISYADLWSLTRDLSALGERPLESAAGQWQFAKRPDAVRTVERLAEAYKAKMDSERAFETVAPGLLQFSRPELTDSDKLLDHLLSAIAVMGGTTSEALLEERRNENASIRLRIEGSTALIRRLLNLLPLKSDLGEDELRAASTFVQLASAAPQAIIGKNTI